MEMDGFYTFLLERRGKVFGSIIVVALFYIFIPYDSRGGGGRQMKFLHPKFVMQCEKVSIPLHVKVTTVDRCNPTAFYINRLDANHTNW